MSNDLMIIDENEVVEIFGTDENKIDSIIEKIEEEVRSFHLDISTPTGRKEIASLAHKVARTKTALDGMGKGLTDEARKKIGSIDAERRHIRERLDALKEEVRKPLTEYEDKEKDRIKGHEVGLNVMSGLLVFIDTPDSDGIAARINDLRVVYQRDWEEFSQRAENVFNNTDQKLRRMLEDREKQDAEQAELERLRKENEERERKERDERIANEAAEKAKQEAETLARIKAQAAKDKADREREAAEAKVKAEKEAAERKAQAERDEIERKAKENREAAERQRLEDAERIRIAEQAKKDAETKAKQDAEEAERRRIEADDRSKREADEAAARERQRIENEKQAEIDATAKREANKKHRAKINNESLKCLTAIGLTEDTAKSVITAIAKGEIKNVSISY